MAVKRSQNWLGNERVDSAFLRSIESGVCGDFDVLAGSILAGRQALITSGFSLVTTGITKADQLQLKVANGSLIHYNASDSGSIFKVESNVANETLTATNNNVTGGFVPSSINYIGIDLVRSVDDSTSDLAMFIDSTTLTESPNEVPLARTLNYRIVISTTDFNSTPSVAPVAKVTTGSTNDIILIEDARAMFWRLGAGGTTPNSKNFYSWPTGRNEATYSDAFFGADKSLSSLKNWVDAAMSRIWEVGGGEYWYSPTTDKNVHLVTSGSPFTLGEYFEFVSNNLHWKGLVVLFDNSTGYRNEIAAQTSNQIGLTDIADGECIYVDIDRTQNRTGGSALVAAKAVLTQLGAGTIPGSRYILAWRYGTTVFTRLSPFPVGTLGQVATTVSNGIVSVSATPTDPLQPFAVLLETSTYKARAGGLSRGNIIGGGFVGGAGDIVIGGGTNDQNITVVLTPTANVTFTTLGSSPAGKIATKTIINATALANSAENLALKVVGNNATNNQTAFQVEGNGAIGFRLSPTTVATPAPAAGIGADKIAFKAYGKTNGLGTPNTRNQLVILDTDGSESVIWEGNAY